MSLPTLNGVGRLVADPAMSFTPSGKAKASMRVAFSDRKKDENGNWQDGDRMFVDATVWGQEAENLCESLRQGQEVSLSGRMKQREYTDREGQKRVVYEVIFATVAPTLRFATASINKMARSTGTGQQASGSNDPWSTAASASAAVSDEAPF